MKIKSTLILAGVCLIISSTGAFAEAFSVLPEDKEFQHIKAHQPGDMDEDHDGKITLFEFMWHKREFFDMLDVNGDEAISDRELGEYKQAIRRIKLINKKKRMLEYHQGLLQKD